MTDHTIDDACPDGMLSRDDGASIPAAGGAGAGQRGGDIHGAAAAMPGAPRAYRQPPMQYRFRPGQSGNPKGRPKSARGLRNVLENELNQKVRGSDNGKSVQLTKLEVVVKRLVEKAGKGEQRAIEVLVDLTIKLFGADNDAGKDNRLTAQEEALLEQLLAPRAGGDAEAGHQPALDQGDDDDDDETDE